MNGYAYRVVVSGSGGLSTPSTSATLTVNTAPAITSQPIDKSINEGSDTSFSVTATGTGLAYQWQVDTGSGFTNITDTGVYSGTATDTLSITGAEAGMNGYAYRVVVSGAGGLSIPSTSATLTVNTAPSITSQPSDKSVNDGSDTSFVVAATGTGLGYQWQVDTGTGFTNLTDTGVYSGTATDTLTITGAAAGMNGYAYRVVVSGSGGLSTPSTSVTLTVNTAPTITSQPSNQSVNDGSDTSFVVAATGTNLTYQWQVDTGSGFTNITDAGVYSGAATDTLSITGAEAGMNGNTYRVVVSGADGLTTSSTSATLTVNTAPSITSQPIDKSINEGSDTSFSVAATGTGLAYQWQVDTGTGFTNLTDTGVYSGTATDTLSITGAAAGMNGYAYRVVVSGSGGLTLPSTSATLTVNTAPTITSQPSNQSVNGGSDTSFSVAATGTGLAYQWQVDTGSGFTNLTDTGVYSGTSTDTLSITGAEAGMNGYAYRVVVSGAGGLSIPSTSATLTMNTAPTITSQPSNQSVNEGSNTSFSVTATGTALTYQWQVDTGSGFADITDTGVYSGAATDTLSITGAEAGMNGNTYRVVVSGAGGLTLPSTSATLTVNTAPAITSQPSNQSVNEGSDTSFSVTATGTNLTYQWQVDTGSGSGFTNITDTGVYSGAATDTLSITGAEAGMNGYAYRVVVSGAGGLTLPSTSATLTVNTAPTITSQPSDKSVNEGSDTSFTVAAAGTSLTYQWQVDTGTGFTNLTDTGVYSGAATDTLSITGAEAGMNGYAYRVVVSGAGGLSTPSTSATLTVNTAPTITSQPSNQSVNEGSNTSFSVTATGTGLGYQWQVDTVRASQILPTRVCTAEHQRTR